VAALAQVLATVRITLALGMAMGVEAPMEVQFLSLQDTRSSHRPSWFIRPAHLKLP